MVNVCLPMEINQMRHFCAVVELNSVRKAAEFLNISPGALSKSLSKLQGQLDVRLFLNQGRLLVLTEEGRQYYRQIKKILDEIDNIKLNIPVAEGPTLSLGSFEVFSSFVFTELIDGLSGYSKIKILELTPGKLEEALTEGLIDFGVSHIPVPNDNIVVDKICDISFGVFCAEKWTKVAIEDLPFSVPTTTVPQNPLLAYALDTWPASRKRKINFEFELLHSGLLSASQGQSAIFCPRFVARLHNQYLHKPLQLIEHSSSHSNKTKQSVFLMRRRDRPEDAICKKMAKHLRLLCRDS